MWSWEGKLKICLTWRFFSNTLPTGFCALGIAWAVFLLKVFPVLWCSARLSRVLGCNDNTATSTRFPSYSQNHSDFGICQTNHKNMDQESGAVISASSVGEIPPGILQLVKMSPCLESLGRLRGRGNTRELETHLEWKIEEGLLNQKTSSDFDTSTNTKVTVYTETWERSHLHYSWAKGCG